MAFCNLQPTTQWMQTPETISDCPPGLEYLIQINQLLVCQRFDLLEVLGCFATSKKYEIMNNQGQRIYFAEDRSNCFLRYLCGPSRPFTMTIYDHVGRDVITIKRTLRSSCCWRNCSVQKLLSLDEEIVLGKISKKWAGFMITNADTFGIQFPFNLDVKIKALMLGASFLIFQVLKIIMDSVFTWTTCTLKSGPKFCQLSAKLNDFH
ncbi:phospholipid scramblase 1-like isoform X3 [Suricata suricatta]|uniref:phospholipid scramblase 1-like isoform X3 n=1 Tax=Suricata suricatta TaxID=37032 RepID=UPI0011557CB3|nr:phospholipid scramblase 1-like isoform X3 [Suricata suricatta]